MDYLSLCALVKDERPFYLEEWIVYHQLIGVDHFYIYDNGSKNPVKYSLAPHVSKGIVSVIDAPGEFMEPVVFNDFIHNYGKNTRWVGVCAPDEYLLLKDINLKEFLSNYEEFGGLSIYWKIFGSSGHKASPLGLTIENYQYCIPLSNSLFHEVKTFADPNRIVDFSNSHRPKYKYPFYGVNEQKYPIDIPGSPCSTELSRFNHYTLRSLEDYKEKLERGNAMLLLSNGLGHFWNINKLSTEIDSTIVKHADSVEKILGINSNYTKTKSFNIYVESTIPDILMRIYYMRPDVSTAFPNIDSNITSYYGFIDWLMTYTDQEYPTLRCHPEKVNFEHKMCVKALEP